MRKEALIRFTATAALIGSAAFSAACNNGRPSSVDSHKTSITLPVESRSQWDNLPATERLRRITTRDLPPVINLNRQQETKLATVQNYCSQTSSSMLPDELMPSIEFVNEDKFISQLSAELGIILNDAEIAMEKESRLAIATLDGKIYINQDLIDKMAKDMEVDPKLKNYDPKTVLEISTITHELVHKDKEIDSVSFKGFSLSLPGNPNAINFNKLIGFKIEGKDTQGKEYNMLGGDEAITDYAASIIAGKRTGLPFISPLKYSEGSKLIGLLNRVANISDEEFLGYVEGKMPQSQLLEKWGAHRTGKFNTGNNLKTGILTLAEVAIVTQGLANFQEVEKDINDNFAPTPDLSPSPTTAKAR